ncbi:hypothetical protein LEP3755_34150 [Leptolyngbya sp. NIES-3755]|nr:hypothetical protein LEP3755_34150 [Leptolyngbya sp. NIES-3755]
MELNQLIPLLRTVLATELGTISTVTAPTRTLPAITTDPSVPTGSTVTGLLCTVQRVQEGLASEVTNGKYLDFYWQVRLVQFDKTKSIDKALKLIQEHPQFRVRNVVYQGSTSQSYEQCRITLWNPSLILY